MAKCTPVRNEVTFQLELTEAEARYVYAALTRSTPARDSIGDDYDDPVWDALEAAFEAAGLTTAGADAVLHRDDEPAQENP